MKKAIVFMMALSLVVFALPAIAQTLSVGSGNANNNMVGGDITDDSLNKGATNSHVVSGEANYGSQVEFGSGNVVGITDTTTNSFSFSDTSSTTTSNTTTLTNSVSTTNSTSNTATIFHNDTITASNNTAVIGIDAIDSVNDNLVYWGDMTNAHAHEYEFAHQNDHQVQFAGAFADSRNVTPYMPISNAHLSQANTGLNTGDGAGSVGGGLGSGAAINYSGSTVAGVLGASTNLGGVAQNQAAVNVVTAFAP